MNPTNIETRVNPLRSYLGSLAKRIGKAERDLILFYAEELTDRPINKQERENIKDSFGLFVKLQEVGHIDDNQCSVLVQLLKEANLHALAIEVEVRYDIGFHKDISDTDLQEKVKLKKLDQSAQHRAEPDSSHSKRQIPCETCKSYFKELEEALEKYAQAKNLALQRALRERNDAESDVKQWEGRLESVVHEKNTLERELEMGKKIQDRVIQEKEKLEQELTEKTHEVGKMEDLHRENEKFKSAHDKLEADIKKKEEELKRVTREKNRIEEQLEYKKKLEKRRLKEVQDRLDSAIKERDGLERQLEMTKREVKQVEDFHKKEKEKLENAKFKAESISQQIQAQLDRVIKERERLEKQLAQTKQEEAKKVTTPAGDGPGSAPPESEMKPADKGVRDTASESSKTDSESETGSESESTDISDSGSELGMSTSYIGEISKLSDKYGEETSSSVEPKPIGGTEYIGMMYPLRGKHGGSKWTVQVLGSHESGTEPGQFNYPKGLAWHGDQLVICDTENHRIKILNKNKVVIEIIRFDGQFDKEFKPWDVAISPDGHFFITDIGNNQIIICNQNKKIIQIIPQSADIEVRSITVMAAFIFVTDSKGKSLIKYNMKDGKLVARVSDQFSDPYSVMATSNNHLLVSDYDKHVIHILDSDLNFLNSYRNDRLKYPQGFDVDSHGNIYICRKLSLGIVKLRSDGQLDCVLFEDVEYYPEFIAVNDDITTTIATTSFHPSYHQIFVFSVST